MRRILIAAAWLVAAGCAGNRVQTVGEANWSSAGTAAAVDTVTFTERLAAFGDLPVADRLDARLRAEAAAEPWRDFELEAQQGFDRHYRHWYYRDNPVPMDHQGVGLPNAIADLRTATDIDPSFTEAWGALGRLTLEAGDLDSARRILDYAGLAADAEAAAGHPLDPELRLRIHRDRAWALRDLAMWDEGLAAVDAGLAIGHGDPELLLVKGLLLADSGRYAEATALAARMPALQYPRYDFLFRGFMQQTSAFANNWIRAQALMAQGNVEDAYWILGDLDLYAYRGLLPLAPRYWRDAALIAELHGDPKAPLYYAVGYVTRPYQSYYPVTGHSVAPLVLDVPDPRVPAYLGYGMRFYVAGSPLVYVGLQINRMAMSWSGSERLQAGGRALRMLEVLQKRHVLPDVCRALRGRIYYAGGDLDLARVELDAARTAFTSRGRVDAGTSLLLGLIAMRDEQWDKAEAVLVEATGAEPGSALAWRSLGVVLAKRGRVDEAEQAMDRALALDPGAVAGWYNRGLLNLQRQQFAGAVADLDHALALDPDNREVQRLLQMAAAGRRAVGDDPLTVSQGPPPGLSADPDTLLATMQTELAGALAAPDSLRSGTPGADDRFRDLETAYLLQPDPARRLLLAQAYLDRNLLDSLQALLAPGWGRDLTPAEELMLLWSDRNLGEAERAEQTIKQVMGGGPASGNAWVLAMAADIMRTSVNPFAAEGHPFSHKNFFFWWKTASQGYQASGVSAVGKIPAYAVDLYRQYRGDPLLSESVWGLNQTPIAGVAGGVGTSGTIR